MTTQPKPTAQLDAELRDLWCRRQNLDEDDSTRLCRIVMAVLHPYKPIEWAGLRGYHEDYINDFLVDKVLRHD